MPPLFRSDTAGGRAITPLTALNTDEFAALSQVIGPVSDVGVLAQQRAALALGQPAPHAKFHAVIKGICAAFR